MCVSVCVCVCVWERERERERVSLKIVLWKSGRYKVYTCFFYPKNRLCILGHICFSSTMKPNVIGTIYINIYIYVERERERERFYWEKTQTGHIRIINLFPSCYGFSVKYKNTKKINRSSWDLMDKINQSRHRKEGWEGDRRGVKSYRLI